MCNITHPDTIASDFIARHKQEIAIIRENIKLRLEKVWKLYDYDVFTDRINTETRLKHEKQLVSETQKFFKEITGMFKKFISKLVKKCERIIGSAPCLYAVVGLGSMAREEMTPYSDLEFVILIQEENENNLNYFRNLTHLLHIMILNLGETPLPALAIKSLNDFDTTDKNSFYDSVVLSGFKFDGAMPWACKTPVGRPDRPGKPGVEMIRSPKRMAEFQKKDIATKEGYHLADMLATTIFITGNQEIYDDYSKYLDKNLEDGKLRGLKSFVDDMKKYGVKMQAIITGDGKNVNKAGVFQLTDIKQEIYRLATTLVNNWKLIYDLLGNSPWDVLKEMKVHHCITYEQMVNLQVAISISTILRLHAYMQTGRQGSKFCLLPELHPNKENDSSFLQKTDVIMRFYFTILPLIQQLTNVIACKEELMLLVEFKHLLNLPLRCFLMNDVLYGNTYDIRAIVYLKLDMCAKAKNCYGIYFENLLHDNQEKDFEKVHVAVNLNDFGLIQYNLGQLEQALNCLLSALKIVNKLYKNQHRFHYKLYHNIGLVYGTMHEYKMARTYFEKSVNVARKIHGDGFKNSEGGTLALASLVSTYGQLKYYREAMDTLKELNQFDGCKVAKAVAYHDIGIMFFYRKKYKSAQTYHEKALEMRRELYGYNCVNREIADSLQNLAVVYSAQNKNIRAIQLFKESLNIYEKLFGVDYPHHSTAHAHWNLARTLYKLSFSESKRDNLLLFAAHLQKAFFLSDQYNREFWQSHVSVDDNEARFLPFHNKLVLQHHTQLAELHGTASIYEGAHWNAIKHLSRAIKYCRKMRVHKTDIRLYFLSIKILFCLWKLGKITFD